MNHQSKKPSIRDIAALAGVSVATVSRVINNNGRFSEETRKRVQAIIDENGYVTNMAARSLRSSRSRTVGLIIPDISNEWFSQVVLEIEKSFFEEGYSVFICNTSASEEKEARYFRLLDSKMVDGIICISGQPSIPVDAISRSIPIICIDRKPETDSDICYVESDHFQGGYLATSALIEHGCRRIVMVSRHHELSPSLSRYKGYLQALADHGIAPDERLHVEIEADVAAGTGTRNAMDALLAQGVPFDGVFATNDSRAFQVISSLLANGINVPRDVKVIGFDDTLIASACRPSITTIHQDVHALAQAARDLFLKITAGQKLAEEERHRVIPVSLVERESTGA